MNNRKESASHLNPCCRKSCEDAYRQFVRGKGQLANSPLQDWVELLLDKYGTYLRDIPVRTLLKVTDTPQFVNAFAKTVRCESCANDASIVIVGTNLLLLTWRIQMIYVSMIEEWSETIEGMQTKHRVVTRGPTEKELNQARIAVKNYVEGERVTQEGLDELVRAVEGSPRAARTHLTDAVNVGQLWIIGHEIAHPVIELWRDVRESKSDLKFLAAFHDASESYIRGYPLSPQIRKMWITELQADLFALYTLLIGLTEKRQQENLQLTKSQNNEMAAMVLLGGIGAACDALYFVSNLKKNRSRLSPLRATHPPLHLRFDLMSRYARKVIEPSGVYDIRSLADVIGGLSKSFQAEWLKDQR